MVARLSRSRGLLRDRCTSARSDEIEARCPQGAAPGRRDTTSTCCGPRPHAQCSRTCSSAREGTLAYFERIHLKLSPLPQHKVLGVCISPRFYAGDGFTAAHRQARPRRGGAGRSHDDRSGARQSPRFGRSSTRFISGEPDADPAGGIRRRRHERAAAASCSELDELMADLGLPGQRGRDHRRRAAEGHLGSAQGRAQHHDVDEGRRQAGVLHRGLRGAARAPRRVHRRV